MTALCKDFPNADLISQVAVDLWVETASVAGLTAVRRSYSKNTKLGEKLFIFTVSKAVNIKMVTNTEKVFIKESH